MDNWLFIVIIIVAVVSSMLNKRTKSVTRGPIEKPNDYDTPSPAYHPKDETNQSRRSEDINRKTSESNKYKNDNIYEQNKLKQEEAAANNREEKKEFNKVKENLNQEMGHDLLNPNRLIEGMVWAEVLGPPRCKKSHYSSQRNKYNRV